MDPTHLPSGPDLTGIDLAQWGADQPGGPGTFDVTFFGTRSDSSTVNQTFQVERNAGSPILQPFLFSGFTDLVSVTFQQGVFGGGTAYQFNNVVLEGDFPATVPDSGSLSLVGMAVGFVIAMRRRWARA